MKGIPAIDPKADIVVTCCQDWPEGTDNAPQTAEFPGPRTFCLEGCTFVVADIGGPGVQDIRVLDIVREDTKNVRWRDVERLCMQQGVDHVPISYRGVGELAPSDLLDKAPFVAFRLEARGPWLVVRCPVRGGTAIEENITVIETGVDLSD